MRRVLIITYDFPPTGGPGVQRVAKFAKYLPRFGWYPVVLTTRHGRPIPKDETLVDEVAQVEVHRTVAPHLYRLASTVKGWLGMRGDPERFTADLGTGRRGPWHPSAWLIPDAKMIWIPFALIWALRNRSRACDLVLSTIPTPSAAILGDILSRLWRVPHVIDYRDPWSGAVYLPRRVAPLQKLERRLERRILSRAAAVLSVPGAHESLLDAPREFHVLHNGYDESDFQGIVARRPGDGFVVAHVGLMWKERGFGPLVSAFRDLLDRLGPDAGSLHFLQVGRTEPAVRRELELLRSSGARVSVLGSVSHHDAIAYMLGADLLYLPTSHDHIPGKTYEYLRSGTPILALGPRRSHLERLLEETRGGWLFEPDDTAGIALRIERLVVDRPRDLVPDANAVARYQREAETRTLAGVLDRLC